MINVLAIVALGLVLGMRHATDPDHVIAVTTIVSRERDLRQAGLIGIFWGLGHTLTIFGVGSAIILFRIALPARVGLGMEMAVAVMLVVLGLKNMGPLLGGRGDRLRSTSQPNAPTTGVPGSPGIGLQGASHAHSHGFPGWHAHPVGHEVGRAPGGVSKSTTGITGALDGVAGHRLGERGLGRLTLYQVMRPLIIGIVHGLAGSAAIALLVLGTIQSVGWAIAYLLIFGMGTIVGMMLITLTIASGFSLGQRRLQGIGRHFGLASGLLSLAFGIFIAYQVGVVGGLFSAHVQWTPH
jgi:hypothetical protein